jgi:hypothetical protein
MKTKKTARHKAKIIARRPAHKKFLLHPATVFFLLCLGVLLIGWTWRASAVSYSISARIPAAPLTEPATITNPADGASFSSKPIDVSGTCPNDSYVKILRNGEFAGVAICDNATNTYGLQIDLVTGANQLEPHDFNITDDEGPAPTPITVYYNPPVPPSPPATSSGGSNKTPGKTAAPFTLTSDYQYKGYAVGEELSWHIAAHGGFPPYALTVKWGDAKEDTYSSANGDFTLSHTYQAVGDYSVKINGADNKGGQSFLELAAVVKAQTGTLQVAGNSREGLSNLAASTQAWLWLAWPAYATSLLMVFSYYLGERAELMKLLKSKPRSRRSTLN